MIKLMNTEWEKEFDERFTIVQVEDVGYLEDVSAYEMKAWITTLLAKERQAGRDEAFAEVLKEWTGLLADMREARSNHM